MIALVAPARRDLRRLAPPLLGLLGSACAGGLLFSGLLAVLAAVDRGRRLTLPCLDLQVEGQQYRCEAGETSTVDDTASADEVEAALACLALSLAMLAAAHVLRRRGVRLTRRLVVLAALLVLPCGAAVAVTVAVVRLQP